MSRLDPTARTAPLFPDSSSQIITHALSVREPYGYLIAAGWKPVEIRSVGFPKNHPLPTWIAIHTSINRDEISDGYLMQDVASMSDDLYQIFDHQKWEDNPKHRMFACSEIIGAMRVVGSVPGDCEDESQLQIIRDAWSGRSDRCRTEIDPREWLSEEGHNWIIDDAVRFKNPIVCKGLLNVWRMPVKLAALTNVQFVESIKTGGIARDEAYGVPTVFDMPSSVDRKYRELYKCGA